VSIDAGFNEDFLDMLRALDGAKVEHVVVGAHALAAHGVPRATGDLDILIRASPQNAPKVLEALRAFGAPLDEHSIGETDFTKPDLVYQIGLPPRRIDLLTGISGVAFDDALRTALFVDLAGMKVAFLGREALLANKRAAGRDKDLLDLKLLEGK
jgi:predicted nucleotidyltransferase